MLTPLDESGKKDKREAQSRQGNNGQDDFVSQLTLTGELRVHSAFIAHGNVGFQHETERYDTCALQAHKPHYIVYTRPASIANDGRGEGEGVTRVQQLQPGAFAKTFIAKTFIAKTFIALPV